jgi:hypothetical protein
MGRGGFSRGSSLKFMSQTSNGFFISAAVPAESEIEKTRPRIETKNVFNFILIPDYFPETAVGVHGFSVFFSWQFHTDKTAVAALSR